jgi:hypothetical protein
MNKVLLAVFLQSILIISTALAQKNDPPLRIAPDLVSFFTGHWTGEGQFAQGRKIAADLSFELSLDS